MSHNEDRTDLTLPDLLRNSLDVVFIGINPSVFSASQGHYFARRSNRFWPCFSYSILSTDPRTALGVARLESEHDRVLGEYGFGFTDLVKRATAKADELQSAELAAGVAALVRKLERYRPRIACFHGVTGYRHVQHALTPSTSKIALGPQSLSVGVTRLFVVPNPSGANAHYTRADQTHWYDLLATELTR